MNTFIVNNANKQRSDEEKKGRKKRKEKIRKEKKRKKKTLYLHAGNDDNMNAHKFFTPHHILVL